jgi:hypothetical protein
MVWAPMSRDRLAFYPYVIVRVSCRHCVGRGSYRLARLGAKYGPEIELDDLLRQLPGDCPNWKLAECAAAVMHPSTRTIGRRGAGSVAMRFADRIASPHPSAHPGSLAENQHPNGDHSPTDTFFRRIFCTVG